jgi:pseudouridine synthase
VVREGRKREVRRIFDAVGHPVRRLVRERLGPIGLADLAPGAWRELSPREVSALRRTH